MGREIQRKLWSRRGVIAVLAALLLLSMVVVTGSWLWQNAFPPPNEAELRERVDRDDLCAAFRRVAGSVLAHQSASASDAAMLSTAGVGWWEPFADRSSGRRYVQFEFGGADRHYGILVTEAGVAPEIGGWYRRRWHEDMWFYSEIPPRRPLPWQPATLPSD